MSDDNTLPLPSSIEEERMCHLKECDLKRYCDMTEKVLRVYNSTEYYSKPDDKKKNSKLGLRKPNCKKRQDKDDKRHERRKLKNDTRGLLEKL